jgi:mannose-6-phosphate isomerase
VQLLTNPIQPYAWGSRVALAALQGRQTPSAGPEAELWLGAHPSAPSLVAGPDGPVTLIQELARNPSAHLGPSTVQRFGARLPYLMKILAAAQPLSLQVHPDAEQARAGYAAEDAAGVPHDAAHRTYVDPYHKPELLVAVEPFDALCGFRDPDMSASMIESLAVPALDDVVAALRRGSVAERLRNALQLLLAPHPDGQAARVLAAAQEGSGRADPPFRPAHELVARLAAHYPTDLGVVVALLLNQVRLQPDEAVFMPAGNLHSYLGGVGVEIMASSDNVLRGGLTPKRVNVAELLRLVRFEVLTDPVLLAVPLAPGLLTWPVPVQEFTLVKASVTATTGPVALPGSGPRIAVCLRGRAEARAGGASQSLQAGQAVFLSVGEPPLCLTGEAVVFQAAPAP